MDNLLLIPIIASFLISFLLIPKWIKKAKQINLMWSDMNKIKSPKVAGSGGLPVVFAFTIGVLLYVAYRVLILNQHNSFLVEIFALLTSVLILAGIGFTDDILVWQKGGLSQRTRIIAVACAAIPLIVINAGKHAVSIPYFGIVNLGIIYPLLFIPIGIIGATTTFNFLAGFNGLEAGQGILILSSFAIITFFRGNSYLTIIALCMIASLLAFLMFNVVPAKIFPGDVLTYSVGGLIAIFAILGDFEKIAVFIFTPYIAETILKLRGNLEKYSFGKPQKDGSLDLLYSKIYGLEHLSILLMKKLKIKPTERKVVVSLWILQIIIIILAFIIFKQGIFG